MNQNRIASWMAMAGLVASAGCMGGASDGQVLGSKSQAAENNSDAVEGKVAFNSVLAGVPEGNDRSCGTCHVENEALALSPANVQGRPANDPIFNRIDADNPEVLNDEDLTFNNLKAGLVRVTVTLPPNVDLVPIPPDAVMFVDPATSAQILAGWKASIVPGTKLGDPMPPDFVYGPNPEDRIVFQPEIITPADRKISVWREVPSINNTAYTAPFLFDGRANTLQEQAFGALQAHSQLDPAITPYDLEQELNQIASFEKASFSDKKRPQFVVEQIAQLGLVDDTTNPPDANGNYPKCNPANPSLACLKTIPDPEAPEQKLIKLNAAQTAGKVVYDQACAGCHGTATDDRITDRSIHDGLFFDLDSDGNLQWDTINTPGGPLRDANGNLIFVPRNIARPNDEFINIGASFISQIGQLAGPNFPLFNNQNGVVLPRYRLRFYTDDTRTTKIMDLPPLPVVSGGPPFTPAPDPNKPGAFIVGSNFGPELFTTDPGRALISGDWWDFEGFDVPQLRGIAQTAPYFHDHSQADLATIITTYSQFILPFLPQLDPFFAPVAPGADRLSATQKANLEEFLKVF